MIKTVCAYCGVGCKFEVKNDKLKPLNMACLKGLSQIETVDKNRLFDVKIRDNINEEFRNSNYEEAIDIIVEKIKKTSPQRVGFYLSGQMLNEDYYVANKLAKGFIKTANCDTNSRTCMASAVVGYKKSFGVDYVPVRVKDLYFANLLILIGSNPAEAHVVFFNEIKKAKKKGLKVVVIDPRFTLSAKIADIYIPIKAGEDISFLNLLSLRLIKDKKIDYEFVKNYTDGFEEYKKNLLKLDEDELLKESGITKELFDEFYALFVNSNNIITAWTMGINQSAQGVDKNLAINNLHIITGKINKKGNGPFSLTGQPNAMGGREVGGLSTTLAVHLDFNEENAKKVEKFWNTKNIPTKRGFTAFEMIDKVDVLIICHTDPIYHLPNRKFVEEAFKKIDLVVEINAYKDSETSKFAHIQLPALAFGEKSGTQTNFERELNIVMPFRKRDLLQDWQIFAYIGKKLGYEKEFNYNSSKDVFLEYQEMTKLSQDGHLDIYKADYDDLINRPFVWGEGLFKDNKFLTQNKKAKIYFVTNKNRSEKQSKEYPFILLTGRIRDQWHSGTKTKFSKKLLKHKSLEFVEINEEDAKELGIKDGDLIEVISKRGKLVANATLSKINRKTVFIPITHRDINYLTPSILDPISFEPDYNHTAIKLKKLSI